MLSGLLNSVCSAPGHSAPEKSHWHNTYKYHLFTISGQIGQKQEISETLLISALSGSNVTITGKSPYNNPKVGTQNNSVDALVKADKIGRAHVWTPVTP